MRKLLSLTAVLAVAACGTPAGPDGADPVDTADTVAFTEVDLGGATPVRLAAAGDDLYVAVRRGSSPGLVRLTRDAPADVPLTAATGYGQQALWYSFAADGRRVLAVGGKSGGAHGNVRWSVWTGDDRGVAEQAQTFGTFGGLGAGDLVDGVLPTAGPVLVGTWQSARAGSDIAVWTTDGTTWTRVSSADTALESSRETLKFPMAAAARGDTVVIAGWSLSGGRQRPTVWTGTPGEWTMTALPDPGRAGTATAVGCWAEGCAVAGRVDGRLAVWRLDGGTWTRDRAPDVPVGADDRLVPPTKQGTELVVGDRRHAIVLTRSGDTWVGRAAAGPSGAVTAVADLGGVTYLVTSGAGDRPTLWRAVAD